MNKIIFSLFILISVLAFSQEKNDSSFSILAVHLQDYGGDKIHFSSFKLLKDLSDSTLEDRDTIYIGYYGRNLVEFKNDTLLLKIQKWGNRYLKFPEYSPKNNFESVEAKIIPLDFWRKCEQGISCQELNFTRNLNDKKQFLIIPCGGSFTTIFISGKGVEDKLEYTALTCPPCVNLTSYKDGIYSINMTACGLGGGIKFNLKTK